MGFLIATRHLKNEGVVPEPGTVITYVIRVGENRSDKMRTDKEIFIHYLVQEGWDGQPAEELAEEMDFYSCDKLEIGNWEQDWEKEEF